MSNDEKIFSLIEKMYSEFSNRFEKLEQGQKSLEQGQKDTNEELAIVRQTVARIEHDHGAKLNALFDGYKLHEDRFDRIDKRFDRIENKVDVILEQVANHEVQIKRMK